MRFNHQFYKSASFYFALCFLCWPLAIVVLQPSNIFVNFFQLLFALFGLIMLIFTLFFDDGDTGDWIIAGRAASWNSTVTFTAGATSTLAFL